ncbi:hypothetical protein [Chryseobacterium sp. SIMBA_038]|uniref:hypothetical protein n=1 Tax=Chryseobacterium sp. SIMBA_038 TaxID=3085780 RepID=UPI00397C3DAA
MRTFHSILLAIFCLLMSSCHIQTKSPDKRSLNATTTETINQNDSTCCFSIKMFEENSYKQERNKENFKKSGFSYEYTQESDNGVIIRQVTTYPDKDKLNSQYYVEDITKKWSPFTIQKRYDYKGRLIYWGKSIKIDGVEKSYEYDENGKAIVTTDHEKLFKHTFADIREFLLKEKGIDIYDTRQAIARRVNHEGKISSESYYRVLVLGKENLPDYYIKIVDVTLEIKPES